VIEANLQEVLLQEPVLKTLGFQPGKLPRNKAIQQTAGLIQALKSSNKLASLQVLKILSYMRALSNAIPFKDYSRAELDGQENLTWNLILNEVILVLADDFPQRLMSRSKPDDLYRWCNILLTPGASFHYSSLLPKLYENLLTLYTSPMPQAFVTEAFKSEFRDPWLNVPRFISFVNRNSELFYKDSGLSFMCPYTSLCQASGNGKSRLLREVANTIPSIYLCLGADGISCFPPPSRFVRDSIIMSVEPEARAAGEERLRIVLYRLISAALKLLQASD
jgi:hypothetical protein